MCRPIIFIAALTVFGGVLEFAQARYESYLCAARRNFTSGLFSCNEDCQLSHGAEGGSCLDPARINRYNCFCGPPVIQHPEHERQCVSDIPAYRELCDLDCKCQHGAFTGYCNFNTKTCICSGYNPSNYGCPAESFEHMLLLAKIGFQIRGAQAPAWLNHETAQL